MALTKTEMFTKIATDLADNTTGAITPEVLRGVMTQLADSPIYASDDVKEVEALRASSLVSSRHRRSILRFRLRLVLRKALH